MNAKPYGRVPKIVEKGDVERLFSLRRSGYSVRELGKEFNCSRMAVWRALKRNEDVDWEFEYVGAL